MICRADSVTGSVDEPDRPTRARRRRRVDRDRRGGCRGPGQVLAARTEGGAARPRSRVLGAVPRDARPRVSRRRRKGAVQRLSRLRARRVQEPGCGRLRELPRPRDRRRPSRQPVQFDRLPDVPCVRAGPLRAHVHRLPRQARGPPARHRGARHGRLRDLSPPARDAVDRSRKLHDLPRRASDEACGARWLDGMPRLPPAPRARGRGESRVRVLPCAGRAAAPGRPRCLHRMPRAPRLRRQRRHVRRLPWREDHAGRERGARSPRLHELPFAARSRGRGDRVRALPPGRPGDARERGGMRHLPCAPRRRRGRRRRPMHELPRKGRSPGHGRACGRHRLRVMPQAARLRGTRREDPVPRLPCPRDHARRRESRSRRLHLVPPRFGRARDRSAGGLWHVPRCRTGVRARRSPALRGLPRAARRPAHAHVQHLPREDDRRAAHDDRRVAAPRATARTAPAASRLRPVARPATPRARCRPFMRPPATARVRVATCRPTSRPGKTERDARAPATSTSAITSRAPGCAPDAMCSADEGQSRGTLCARFAWPTVNLSAKVETRSFRKRLRFL